jgi:hypothetical protein
MLLSSSLHFHSRQNPDGNPTLPVQTLRLKTHYFLLILKMFGETDGILGQFVEIVVKGILRVILLR